MLNYTSTVLMIICRQSMHKLLLSGDRYLGNRDITNTDKNL
jgi:hypothetical protein